MSIGLIVLALAFVFFLVVAYFAAQTWHAGHVVALAFLFLFSLLFLFMAATLMRTHGEYRPKYAKALKDYDTAVQQEGKLTFGSPSEPAGEGTLTGERRLAQVQQATSGRSWGNVFPKLTPQTIVLDMRRWTNDGCQKVGQDEEDSFDDPIEPEPDAEASGDAGEDGAVAVVDGDSHGILQDQYLYAFHEIPINGLSINNRPVAPGLTPAEKAYYFGIGSLNGTEFTDQDKRSSCRIPGAYLGRFLVTASTPERITVEAADTLTKTQQQLMRVPGLNWVLLEKLPTDSHEIFAGVEENKLGEMMPPPWFAQRGIQLPPAAYNQIITEYQRDGKEFNGQNSLRTTQEVEFTGAYKHDVNLDVADLPETDIPFTADGLAQVKSLMQDGPAEFEVGDKVVVDGKMANVLINDKRVAKAVGNPQYSRQLRDYQSLLNNFQLDFNEVGTARDNIQAQVSDLNASLKRLRGQIDKHVKELELLQKDQKGFEVETEQLQAFKKLLEQRLEILRGEVQSRSFVTR